MILTSPPDAVVTVEGVLDPLSVDAQLLTPLLILLQDWINPSFRIFLNPQVDHKGGGGREGIGRKRRQGEGDEERIRSEERKKGREGAIIASNKQIIDLK